jgi:hypothetical protein
MNCLFILERYLRELSIKGNLLKPHEAREPCCDLPMEYTYHYQDKKEIFSFLYFRPV